MLVDDKLPYLIADRDFYEPLSRVHVEETDFKEPIERVLPTDWSLSRRDIWYDCTCEGDPLPAKGWKIHLSATLGNAPAILVTAALTLTRHFVPFKFVADKMLLLLVNSKRWSRGGAGKFITTYPRSEEQCAALLEELREVMIGYQGPQILSDRRYRDSKIVHYRYGGFNPTKRMDVIGKPVMVIETDDGEFIDDERTPYFKLPDGMADPFMPKQSTGDDLEPGTLKAGRYKVESALQFSTSGGVYEATDRHTGESVIIKEARPFTNFSTRGLDAVWLLKKEHRLLSLLTDLKIAPRPVDFFQDWEHYYLVEEKLKGVMLRDHLTRMNLSLRTRPELDDVYTYWDEYFDLFLRIAQFVRTLHLRKIVFSDLSFHNVMVLEDGALRLIDFEGAYEIGVDIPTHLFTPGFTPVQMLDEGMAEMEDDYFAFGGLMMAGLFPMNSMLVLDWSAHERFLDALVRDLNLSESLAQLVRELLSQDRAVRPRPEKVIEVLETARLGLDQVEMPEVGAYEVDQVDEDRLAEHILDYVRSTADLSRTDRLYPADPGLFDSNPLSVAHGACGVAYVFQHVTGSVDSDVLEWILAREIEAKAFSPGLYVGLSGIAWTLLELGLEDRAKEILALTEDHHLLWRASDLYYGAAGWGLTQLRFFLETSNEVYLTAAVKAGSFLLAQRQVDSEEPGQCWWPSYEDEICCGLAHGASGVALFLLYLYLATGDDRYLVTGQEGLAFASARGVSTQDGGLTWRAKEGQPTYTPYWRWGSAGVGAAVLRYWLVTEEPQYQTVLDKLLLDTDRKYAIFPTLSFGLAGLGDMYVDLAKVDAYHEEATRSARKLLSGCLLFGMERETGLAFPGESLSRISCDYLTGGAGIAYFAHRLRTGIPAAFLLDELLPERADSTLSAASVGSRSYAYSGVGNV